MIVARTKTFALANGVLGVGGDAKVDIGNRTNQKIRFYKWCGDDPFPTPGPGHADASPLVRATGTVLNCKFHCNS
jgi:hypothetical protein